VSGPAGAPTIVLLHPSLQNRNSYLYQVQAWSKDFRVISMDLPEHGARIDEKLTAESAVHAVFSIISNQVASQKAFIFGWDLGGYVALRFIKEHAEMCLGLILGGAVNETDTASRFIIPSLNSLWSMIPGTVLWEVLPRTYHGSVPRQNFDETLLRSGMNFEGHYHCHEVMAERVPYFYRNILQNSYDGPVLFLNAEKDDRRTEAPFLEVTKRGRLHVIKGATHMAFLEPDCLTEMNEVVLDFLLQTSRGDTVQRVLLQHFSH